MEVHADAAEVAVYYVQMLDPERDVLKTSTFKVTREAALHTPGLTVLEGTGETVDRRLVDAQGRYARVASGWGAREPSYDFVA